MNAGRDLPSVNTARVGARYKRHCVCMCMCTRQFPQCFAFLPSVVAFVLEWQCWCSVTQNLDNQAPMVTWLCFYLNLRIVKHLLLMGCVDLHAAAAGRPGEQSRHAIGGAVWNTLVNNADQCVARRWRTCCSMVRDTGR